MTGPAITYAITDRLRFAGDERNRAGALLAQAARLRAASTSFLQLREKDLAPSALLRLARELRSALPPASPPRLLLNGPVELALAAGCDGVHLPGGWTPKTLAATRSALHAALPSAIVSVTAHSLAEVRAAHAATLILFGPVFGKSVRGAAVAAGLGLDCLREACVAAAGVPVLALGGITPATQPLCLAAGAAGVAGIRLFLGDSLPHAHGEDHEKLETGPC